MLRTRLYADPAGLFLHDAMLAACERHWQRTAIIDTSCGRRISYAEYGKLVEHAARGFVGAGIRPGEVLGIFLCNSWEFAVAYHAATLAGAIPTPLNPTYRQREVRYQLEAAEAVALVTDAAQMGGISRSGLPKLHKIFTTRHHAGASTPFDDLLRSGPISLPRPDKNCNETLAALPFSSGTTGLPKGVMLSHYNLVVNAFQTIRPGEEAGYRESDVFLCFLPLYHIYGLNVVLNSVLLSGGSIVLMPRFDVQRVCEVIAHEGITYLMLVPPAMNALSQAAEQGLFPQQHRVRAAKCGAAPLGKPVVERFTELTGIRVAEGYGMTEASPVTHLGFLEPDLYQPDSVGRPALLTECRIVDESGNDVKNDEAGELVMRGPQFMRGYWKSPEATAEVLRDGWYWSGDMARRDERELYYIIDRRKEMIKYKGFAIAPAEVEAVLLEHPAVRDCGVVGKRDGACGEIPVAFVVRREDTNGKLESELCGYVAERLSHYKQPREVRFVEAIPRNPSGKILRRELRAKL